MLRDLFVRNPRSDLVELITPRRSFKDVVLPQATRDQLYTALMQIDKHQLIFHQWGLGERHPHGTGLAFHFAGPPGTGKTLCAEAVARALGKKLCRVVYSEVESCWAGETGKNLRAVFREARVNDAVLFFDEADSVAARRFTGLNQGYEREANQAVNILLSELEHHDGVVIFATNLAANFDPAFERRIRTHILFQLPGEAEREQIWRAQIHPEKTPLADDVDFAELARRFPVSGGDIKNAVFKGAQIAAAEEGPDDQKRLHQRHFIAGMEQVLAAKQVMQQNLFDDTAPDGSALLPAAMVAESIARCRDELARLAEEVMALRQWQAAEEQRWHAWFDARWQALSAQRWLLLPWVVLAGGSLLALGGAVAGYLLR